MITCARARVVAALGALLVLGACGDNIERPDARVYDARPDAPADAPVDGPCGAGMFVTGELVDIDSTTTSFMGGNAATFTLRGGSASDATSPNGRFELCVPIATSLVFDVDAPPERLDAIAYIEPEALGAMARLISFRSFTPARIASFFVERGLVYDPTKAQVLVFLAGDRSNLTFDRAHDTVQGGNDDDDEDGAYTWAAGQGRYVLFPNVDVTNPTGTLEGDLSGTHTIPLEAGKLTYAALFWVFVN